MGRATRILNKIKEIFQITWVRTLLMGFGTFGSVCLVIGILVWINPAIIVMMIMFGLFMLVCFMVGVLIRTWRDEDPI